jgi:hypothetical protein
MTYAGEVWTAASGGASPEAARRAVITAARGCPLPSRRVRRRALARRAK